MADQLNLMLDPGAPLDARLDALRELFPGACVDGELSAERLLAALGLQSAESAARYRFEWSGRAEAFASARQRPTGALHPQPEASHHFETAENVIIEGDNLEVMKLLLPAYAGRFKAILIDPPYNTGHDFIYADDFGQTMEAYLRQTGQVDAAGRRTKSDAELDGRHHSRWLSMMAPRLVLARELLRSDGAIFVCIDDGELHHLRLLMNEVFGEECFVSQIAWQKRYTRSNNTDRFTSVIDHVLVYQRSDAFAVNLLPRGERDLVEFKNPDDDPRGPWKATSFLNQVPPERRPNMAYDITNPLTGEVTPAVRKAWRVAEPTFKRLQAEGRLWWGKKGRRPVPQVKTYLSEVRKGLTPTNFWSHTYAGHTDTAHTELKELFGIKVFDTPKPSLLFRRMLEHATGPDDLVLDFFAGSGTAAQAVLELNRDDGGSRRYVLVQLPEVVDEGEYNTITEITRARARRVSERLGEQVDAAGRGFRAFRLGPSALPDWHAGGALTDRVDRVAAGADPAVSAEALGFEVALRAGQPLSATPQAVDLAGAAALSYDEGALLLCLAEHLDAQAFDAVITLAPTRFICLERALGGDDALRVQAARRLEAAGVELRTV